MSEKMASPSKKLRLDGHDDPDPTNKPADSPISMLTDDVLFFIFSINSVMEMIPVNKETTSIMFAVDYEEDILTTNRYSSQVCRRWRNIMLSSPTIWASSLNINELNQRGDEWRWEVLDRTGNAPLTLIGRIGYMSSIEGNHVEDFVREILENDWGRMKYFSLCTHKPDIKDYIFYVMREPAPLLEHFLYWTTKSEDDEDYDSAWTPPRRDILFDGYSPKLTFFCCDGVTYNFSQGALSNLRQLWLAGQRATFTVAELYRGLCHLPLLEELNIDHDELLGDIGVGLGESTPTLSLPRLADITIHRFGQTFVSKLVKRISPARACRLVVADRSHDSFGVDVQELSEVYATFIKKYADFEFIPYLSFTYHRERGFSIRAATGPREFRLSDLSSSYPNIAFRYHSDARIGESSNLDLFSAPVVNALASRRELGCIARLKLTLDESATIHSTPHILALLKKLGSVVHLKTDLPTLRVLVDAQVALGIDFVLFPNLTTIVVTGKANPSHDLGVFLDGQSKSGNPIKFLDLPKNSYSNDGRWKFLDDISGLSVVWSDTLNFYYPGEYQFVELNGALVRASTTTSTNMG